MKPIYHEIIGIILLILFIIHLILNIKYIKNILNGKYNLKRTIMVIINIVFLVTFLLSLIFGILSSEDLLSFMNINNMNIISLHKTMPYISLIVLGLHLGINFNAMFGSISKLIKNNIILYIINIIIIVFAVYSYIHLDLWNHITGRYGFSIVTDNILINILEYLSIILMITILTNFIYRRMERRKMKDKMSLIIYFSRADENYSVGFIDKGNTEVVAEYIKDLTGADMFKVEPMVPYAVDYQTCIEEAKERQASHNAQIKENIPDISNYEVIYIGAPVYWGDLPEEMVTALKNIDFSGKIVRPFTTHEGSGLGNIPSQLSRICTGANVTDGLAIRGASVNNAKNRVEDWI